MLLSELEQGAKVLLLLTIDGKHFEFETIVQGKHKHDVLLEPIRKDQKILNVQSDQVDVDIVERGEDGLYSPQTQDLLCIRGGERRS